MNPTIELIIRNKEIHFRKKDNLTTGQQKNTIKLIFEGEAWKDNELSIEAIFRVDDFSLPIDINSDIIEIPFEICKIDYLGRIIYIGFRGTKTETINNNKTQIVYSTPYFRLGVLEQGAVAGDIKPGEATVAPYDEAKELAKAWAIGPNMASETPSATNNAKYWSEQSKKNVQDLEHYAEEASSSAAKAKDSATKVNTALASVNSKLTEIESIGNTVEENKNTTVLAKEEAIKAKEAIVNMVVEAVTLAEGASATVSKSTINNVIKLIFGLPKGATGNPGKDAPKITAITIRQSDYHLIVTLSDNTTYDAGYCRGSAGAGSGDMLMATYDPQGKNQDIFAYVDSKISEIPTPDVSKQISTHNADTTAHEDIRKAIPTKTSQLTNDSNFLTQHQSLDSYALKTELDDKVSRDTTINGNALNSNITITVPIITTAGTGSIYTGTVEGITSLTKGLSLIIIPHTVSTSATCTFNLNNLGAKNICRSYNTSTMVTYSGSSANWLAANEPIFIVYNGIYWVIQSMPVINYEEGYGTLKVSNGGTGLNTIAVGSYLVGNGTSVISLKTPTEVCSDIGALPKSAIVSGILEGNSDGNIIGLEKTEVSLVDLDSYINTKIQSAIQTTWEASY